MQNMLRFVSKPLNRKIRTTQKKDPHCYFYTPDSKCAACQYNYIPSKTNLNCQKIKEKNCLENFENKKCSICKFPFLPNENSNCEKECDIENCVVSSFIYGYQICNACDNGFSVVIKGEEVRDGRGNGCRKEVIPDCWVFIYEEDRGMFGICQVGFFMDSNGVCVKISQSDMTLFA